MSEDLPDWVRWLPREAVEAIDRYWKPVWDTLKLLPAHRGHGEELELEAVGELTPGEKWQTRFDAMWPGYRAWYLREGESARPDRATCRAALERHMPELVPTYERLVELAGADELAARMLTLYRPPGFVVGCSQGAWTRGEPVLVRNYDYPADRLEGIVYLTAWTGRRVLGMSDCLWGLLDGINDAGLAVSLTFGGRADVGDGSGAFLTAYVGPGRPPSFHDIAGTTNHQGTVEWPEYAAAIRSEEREACVLGLLADPEMTRERFVAAFLEPPLRSTQYAAGFGTLYTAAYYPAEGRAEFSWPGTSWPLSLADFREGSRTARIPSSNAAQD